MQRPRVGSANLTGATTTQTSQRPPPNVGDFTVAPYFGNPENDMLFSPEQCRNFHADILLLKFLKIVVNVASCNSRTATTAFRRYYLCHHDPKPPIPQHKGSELANWGCYSYWILLIVTGHGGQGLVVGLFRLVHVRNRVLFRQLKHALQASRCRITFQPFRQSWPPRRSIHGSSLCQIRRDA
jgi:hypothetical protein